MEQKQLHTKSRVRLYLTLFLAFTSVVLVFGSVYARYRSEITEKPAYVAKDGPMLQIWSLTDDGELSVGTADWMDTVDGKALEFGISNGSEASYAEESQKVRIRLLSTVGIDYSDAVQVELYALDPSTGESAVYDAVAMEIQPNTPLYHKFGAGWLFEFQDAFGDEIALPLQGGRFSWLTAEISVYGIEIDNAALLQLMVAADITGE